MAQVGVLPDPSDVLAPTIVPLFGILSFSDNAPLEEEDCHFCLEGVHSNEVYVLKTPCCGHVVGPQQLF